MYYHFKPSKVYWIILITLRKFSIAFIGLMFRQNPGFQLALCLLSLFIFYILQIKHRPYMSSSERRHVVQDHLDKVALYDRLQAKGIKEKPAHAMVHKRIATHMKQALHARDDAGKNTHGTAKVDMHGHGDAGNFDEDEDGGKAKGGVGFGRSAASKKAHSHKIKAEKVRDMKRRDGGGGYERCAEVGG